LAANPGTENLPVGGQYRHPDPADKSWWTGGFGGGGRGPGPASGGEPNAGDARGARGGDGSGAKCRWH
jgi:hypothetical protein